MKTCRNNLKLRMILFPSWEDLHFCLGDTWQSRLISSIEFQDLKWYEGQGQVYSQQHIYSAVQGSNLNHEGFTKVFFFGGTWTLTFDPLSPASLKKVLLALPVCQLHFLESTQPPAPARETATPNPRLIYECSFSGSYPQYSHCLTRSLMTSG